MSTNPPIFYEASIFATNGNQPISVEPSVSFQWVPASGNSYQLEQNVDTYNRDTGATWTTIYTTGPSKATGTVTFEGVMSSQSFQSIPTALSFTFTDEVSINAKPSYAAR